LSGLEEITTATDYILSLFRAPLEAKGACLSSFNDELEEIITYARKYLDIEHEDYKKIWYKLTVTSESKNWPTALLLSELLFSLPFTTSGVERAFSKLKVVKTDRRSSLLISTLNDLLEINIEGPALENYSSAAAVDLWWADCVRRPNHSAREKLPVAADQGTSVDSDEEPDQWDELFFFDACMVTETTVHIHQLDSCERKLGNACGRTKCKHDRSN
jgi:hypothetical protein